jgi:hypothetical protein
MKLAEARAQLHRTLRMKQNGSIYEGSVGITRDSPITPNGTPYAPDHPITARGGRIRYADILQEEDSETSSTSPAVVSGEGNHNWHHWNAEEAIKELLEWARDSAGKIIREKAMPYFLDVNNEIGNTSDNYQIPIAVISEDGMPQYSEDALDNAWTQISGRYPTSYDRALQNKIIQLKRQNNMSLLRIRLILKDLSA